MKKKKRNLVLLLIVVVLIVGISASYAYYAITPNISNNLVVSVKIDEAGMDAYFNVTGTSNISLITNEANMLSDGVGNVIASGKANLNVSLQSYQNMSCGYDLEWSWTSGGYSKTSGSYSGNELTISGTNGSSTISERQVNNSGSVTSLGHFTISDTNKNATPVYQDWQFTLKYYNVNAIQDAHADKTFKGKVDVKNVSCSLT